jgi:hypothetical protein
LGHMHLAALGQGGVLRNLSWARKAHVAHMPETLVLSINREEILISCNLWRAAPYSNKESVPLYTLVFLCSTIIQLSSPWTTLGSKGSQQLERARAGVYHAVQVQQAAGAAGRSIDTPRPRRQPGGGDMTWSTSICSEHTLLPATAAPPYAAAGSRTHATPEPATKQY